MFKSPVLIYIVLLKLFYELKKELNSINSSAATLKTLNITNDVLKQVYLEDLKNSRLVFFENMNDVHVLYYVIW